MAYEEKKPEAYPSEANGPAHEARYQEILAGYRDQMRQYAGEGHNISLGYDAMKKNMAQVGDSQRNALDRQFAQQYGQAQQSMISRGLGNTTVLDAARRGIGYDQANANITLADALAREQAQIHQAKLNQKSQFAQGLAGLQGNMLGYQGQYRGTQQAQDANYAGQYGLAEQNYRMDSDMYDKQFMNDLIAQGAGAQYIPGSAASGTSMTGTPSRTTAPVSPSGPASRSQTPSFGGMQPGYGGGGNFKADLGSNPGTYAMGGDDGYGGPAYNPADTKGPSYGGGWEGDAPAGSPGAPDMPEQDYQMAYGYGGGGETFHSGGKVPGKGNSDTVAAKLTPGEFVLSKEMIADLKSGKMSAEDLVKLFKKPAKHKHKYGFGGWVQGGDWDGASAAEQARVNANFDMVENLYNAEQAAKGYVMTPYVDIRGIPHYG